MRLKNIRGRKMKRLELRQLMIGSAVLLSLSGFTGAATWLLINAIITPEIKGLLFLGWLANLYATLPEPLNKIIIISVIIGTVIFGIAGFLFAGKVWYFFSHLN
jgi:hypothetical protein